MCFINSLGVQKTKIFYAGHRIETVKSFALQIYVAITRNLSWSGTSNLFALPSMGSSQVANMVKFDAPALAHLGTCNRFASACHAWRTGVGCHCQQTYV